MKKNLKITISILLTAVILAGCGAATSDKKTKNKKEVSEINAHNAALETTVALDYNEGLYDSSRSLNYSGDLKGAIDYDIESEYYYDDNSYYTSNNISGDVSVVNPSNQKLIRNVALSLETVDFDGLTDKIKNEVKMYGGYFESSSVSGTGTNKDYRRAYYTIRVPAESLDSLIADLDGTCTVISSSETTTDVTLSYVDTESHIAALKAEQEALLEMLSKAEDVDYIISLQQRLTDIRYELEYYQSSLRTMDNQVDYATLRITLNEVVKETPVEETPEITRKKTYNDSLKDSFNETIEELKQNWKDFLVDFMSFLPYLIIFVIIAIIIVPVIIIVVKVKKNKKKKAKAQAAATEEKPSEENKG